MKISINKEFFKRASTYLNLASAFISPLLGLNGILSAETIQTLLVVNTIIGLAQAISIQLSKVDNS